MAKGSHQKLKLLYLAQILMRETDEEHGLTIAQLQARLEQCGVSADRKTLYLDMEELRQFGLDVVGEKTGKAFTYRLLSRSFELAELKLLVDSVQAAKFITEKKSHALIKKLESLVSTHEARELQRQVLISGRIKTMNESIYYNVDKIHAATSQNQQLRFHYFQWDVDKRQALRHDGAWYVVSPWQLVWDDEYYYLVAYDAAHAMLRHYRVDKMLDITLTGEPRLGEDLANQIDMLAYSKTRFGMFGGEVETVTLEAENSYVGILLDRFGKDIPILRLDEGHFMTKVNVVPSSLFIGWIFP